MKQKLLILAIFIALIFIIKIYHLDAYFTFENLQAQKETLAGYVNANYILAAGAFVGLYIIAVAFMLPIATVLTLGGGFLFGSVFGLIFVNVGATTGAIFAFIFARYMLGEKIQSKYEKQLKKFNKELETNKYQYLFSLRFLPIFPFFLVNLLCGVTKLDLKTFIITTSLGIMPGSFVYIYAGSKLASINSMGDIFTKEILFAFILLGSLTLMPTIIKKFKRKSKGVKAE